jgi:hypothetical protein
VAIRERPADRGRRQAEDDLRRVATGIDHVQIWRFERGQFDAIDARAMSAIGAVLGLDVRFRAYPSGDPIRDAGHARLLERLRREVNPSLRWRTEVALPIEGDLRAWDAVIAGSDWRLMVEAETVIDDVQALERRLARKLRDGGVDHCLLLVADTRRNRRAVAAAPAAFAAWPLQTRELLGLLRIGRRPAAGGIVFR